MRKDRGPLGVPRGATPVAKRTAVSVPAASATDVVVTWDTPFPDTAYTAVATVLQTTAGSNLRVEKILAQAAASITVRVSNSDALNGRGGTVHAIALA